MNTIGTIHQTPIPQNPADAGGIRENKATSPIGGGPALTVTDGLRPAEFGDVEVSEEIEKSLVRNDWIGRAVSRNLCYNTPAMPDFHD